MTIHSQEEAVTVYRNTAKTIGELFLSQLKHAEELGQVAGFTGLYDCPFMDPDLAVLRAAWIKGYGKQADYPRKATDADAGRGLNDIWPGDIIT
jgi:hypothetical protein